MIAEIMFALEERKTAIAKEAIERLTADAFDQAKGKYAGLNDAITIIRNLVSEKGRIDDDL